MESNHIIYQAHRSWHGPADQVHPTPASTFEWQASSFHSKQRPHSPRFCIISEQCPSAGTSPCPDFEGSWVELALAGRMAQGQAGRSLVSTVGSGVRLPLLP